MNADPLMMERSLLGCVIRNRDVLDELPPLHPNDFLDAVHIELWTAIIREAELGRLRNWDANVLSAITGLDRAYLTSLQVSAPRGRNIAAEYAALIGEQAFDRRVRQSCDAILRSEASGKMLRTLVERELSQVLDGDRGVGGPALIGDSIPAWLEAKNKMITEGPGMYIDTGFADVDRRISGLRPGELMIVAGRPATGKTQFALAIAEHNARKGKVVQMDSLEMMSEQMNNRMASRQGVNAGDLRNLSSHPDPDRILAEISDAAIEFGSLPIYVDYSSDDFGAIAAHARRMKRQKNTAVLIVDYLQLVGDDNGGGDRNRTQEVARISRGLKRLAIQLGIPIVALAQLNRELERAGNRRPQLSDLREAGSIEQDADFVVFLWRHELSFPQEGVPANDAHNVIEVITAKGREVQPGTDYLRAEFQHARFKNLTRMERENYRNFVAPQTSDRVKGQSSFA